MKKMLIERLDSFNAAPFTIQRISELLADPRKQYSRIDKFMRAVEKNILVVSTVTPGRHRQEESENGDSLDSALNGEFSSDVNVDIDMDNDGSFTMSKEFSATSHRKDENHEIVAVNHETTTIKKTASKEEEATTSTVAVDPNSGETPKVTETEISIDSQSTVTITVCEPKSDDLPKNESESTKETSVESSEQIAESEEMNKSEAPKESNIPEIIEPKIDDALLNEPIRPADDEILVDTSDIIGATTPLAALENIVAIRTDPSIIEAVEPRVIEPELSSEESQDEIVAEEPKLSETNECEDDSGIEAKRIKIEELKSKPEEVPEKIETPQEETTEQQPSEVKEVPVIEEYVDEPKEENEQPEVAPSIKEVSDEPVPVEITPIIEEPISAEPIDEPALDEVIPEEPVSSAPAETMETVPIVESTTMALDEDEPSNAQNMEITPAANKMDTDENEAETALMDVDDEPMDQ
jgi:serine/threonine-protein phosphatase 4 regulatory subunit 2